MKTTPSETVFEEIYQAHKDAVFRFLLYLSGDWALAQDLTAETFVRVWTTSVPVKVATAKAYLFVIAHNLFLDSVRRRRPNVELRGEVAEPAAPAVSYEHREELAQTLDDLKKIAEGDRAALVMVVFEEMSYEETARALSIGAGSVKSRIFRARLRLNELRQERLQRRPL